MKREIKYDPSSKFIDQTFWFSYYLKGFEVEKLYGATYIGAWDALVKKIESAVSSDFPFRVSLGDESL